jgi:hypothetical protein
VVTGLARVATIRHHRVHRARGDAGIDRPEKAATTRRRPGRPVKEDEADGDARRNAAAPRPVDDTSAGRRSGSHRASEYRVMKWLRG